MDLLLSMINESRASDKAFGATSGDNLVWYVYNFISAAKRAGKNATYLQLKKYLAEHGFTWEQYLELFDFPHYATSARINIPAYETKYGEEFERVARVANQHRDEYDELIDLFWEFHDKKVADKDVSDIIESPKFKLLVDLFKEDPEKAQEIFGRHYDKAKRWMARFINVDFENSYEAALDEFWLWHRKVKNGDTEATLNPEVVAKLKELVKDQDKAIEIIGNRGLFYFVARKVNELSLDNEDFDIGDDSAFDESYDVRPNKLMQFINEDTTTEE